jgi:hypothetical protein
MGIALSMAMLAALVTVEGLGTGVSRKRKTGASV